MTPGDLAFIGGMSIGAIIGALIMACVRVRGD